MKAGRRGQRTELAVDGLTCRDPEVRRSLPARPIGRRRAIRPSAEILGRVAYVLGRIRRYTGVPKGSVVEGRVANPRLGCPVGEPGQKDPK